MALGLRQLRYFIAIADAGVLSRAAETLNVAQSALSHHVAALETDLGVKLLERRPRGIALTAAGRRLYEHASAVLSALGKAEEDVRTYNEAATGPVCIGLSHTALSMVALDVMKAVRKNSPGVHLTVVEALSPALVERVFSGTVDLALAYNPPEGCPPGRRVAAGGRPLSRRASEPDRPIIQSDRFLCNSATKRGWTDANAGIARHHPNSGSPQPDHSE